MLLHQLKAWLRRKSRRGVTSEATSERTGPNMNYNDPKESLPTYDSLGPIPRVLTPLAQRDPATAARYKASLSASAITARAIAEGPDAARAMDKGLRRIHNTVPKIIQAYGVEDDHRLVALVWAAAISASADTARDIAQSTKPSYAMDFARRWENAVANGEFDALLLHALDVIEAGSGVRIRHKAATEASLRPKDGIAG